MLMTVTRRRMALPLLAVTGIAGIQGWCPAAVSCSTSVGASRVWSILCTTVGDLKRDEGEGRGSQGEVLFCFLGPLIREISGRKIMPKQKVDNMKTLMCKVQTFVSQIVSITYTK
jgi:hypothetical protein